MTIRVSRVLMSFVLVSLVGVSEARAVGGSRPNPGPQEPADRQAFPQRAVKMGDVVTSIFRTPDGRQVDAGVAVRDLVETQINQSEKFHTYVPNPPTAEHTIIKGVVTSLVLELAGTRIKFGYTPNGNVNEGATELVGEVTVNVAQLTMDFSITNSITGENYGAVSVDEHMAGVNLSFKVNFSQIEIGPEFFWNTPLKDAIRGVTAAAMRQMTQQPRINFIPWTASVLDTDVSKGIVMFNAGFQEGVRPGDNYGIYYNVCNSFGCFERHHGDVKVSKSIEYSEAKVKNDTDHAVLRAIKPGDKVYIQYIQ